jgi:hypothetical protein
MLTQQSHRRIGAASNPRVPTLVLGYPETAAGERRGVLPRQGHEYAEQIKSASAQMERLRQDLVGSPDSNGDEKAA